MAVQILKVDPSTEDVGVALRWMLAFFPTFCVGQGILPVPLAQPEYCGEVVRGLERYLQAAEEAEKDRDVFLDLFYPYSLSSNLKQSCLVDKFDACAFENLTGNIVAMLIAGLATALLVFTAEARRLQKGCSGCKRRKVPAPDRADD